MTDVLSSGDYGVFNVFTTWSGIVSIVAGLVACSGLTNFKVNNDEKSYKHYCSSTNFSQEDIRRVSAEIQKLLKTMAEI